MSRLAQMLWLVSSLVCSSVFAEGGIRWAPDLAAARRAAAQFQVPLLVHFYGDNCIPCKTLEQRVYSQDSVAKTLNKYFICVRVNASKDPAVATQFQVHSWPTDVFISPDGQVLFQGVSKQDIGGYVEVLQNIAVMNRDRNTLLATERTQAQASAPSHIAGNVAVERSSTASTGGLPPTAPPSTSQHAAPPAIASSTPARQFHVAPPAQPAMMDSQAGLPPLPAHLASKPLGSNGLDNTSPARQINAQANMPVVAVNNTTNRQNSQKQVNTGATSSFVDNPYYQNSEALVCGPDGKCGPAPGTKNNPMHLASNLSSSTDLQYPTPPGPQPTTTPGFPTLQLQSRNLGNELASGTSDTTQQPSPQLESSLIKAKSEQAAETAAYGGFCPVALVTTGQKIQGSAANAVRHRGRTYLIQSPEAVKQFMQAPDRYSPILSGYDPMIFLLEGKLVDGVLDYALHDPTNGIVVLFASAETQMQFKSDPARNAKALTYILNAANR